MPSIVMLADSSGSYKATAGSRSLERSFQERLPAPNFRLLCQSGGATCPTLTALVRTLDRPVDIILVSWLPNEFSGRSRPSLDTTLANARELMQEVSRRCSRTLWLVGGARDCWPKAGLPESYDADVRSLCALLTEHGCPFFTGETYLRRMELKDSLHIAFVSIDLVMQMWRDHFFFWAPLPV